MSKEKKPSLLDRRQFVSSTLVGASALSALSLPKVARARDDNNQGQPSPLSSVLGLFNSFSTLNADTITSFLAEDVLFEQSGLAPITGRAEIAGFLGQFLAAFESISVTINNSLVKHRLVAVEKVEHYALLQNPPFGNPGARLDLKSAAWLEVDHDGLITRWSDYFDTRVLVAVLGIPLPPPTP